MGSMCVWATGGQVNDTPLLLRYRVCHASISDIRQSPLLSQLTLVVRITSITMISVYYNPHIRIHPPNKTVWKSKGQLVANWLNPRASKASGFWVLWLYLWRIRV